MDIKCRSSLGWVGATGLRNWLNVCLDYSLTRTGKWKPETGSVLASVIQPRPDHQLWLPVAEDTKRHSYKNFPLSFLFLFIFPHMFFSICILTLCISRDKRAHSCFHFCFSWCFQFFPLTGLPANSFHSFLSIFCSQRAGSVFNVFLAKSKLQEELKCWLCIVS